MSVLTYSHLLWESTSKSPDITGSLPLHTAFQPPNYRLGDYGTFVNGKLRIEGNILIDCPLLESILGNPVCTSAPFGWSCANSEKKGSFMDVPANEPRHYGTDDKAGWKYDAKAFAAILPVSPMFLSWRNDGLVLQFLLRLKSGEIPFKSCVMSKTPAADSDVESFSDNRTAVSHHTTFSPPPSPFQMTASQYVSSLSGKVLVTSVLVCKSYFQLFSMGSSGTVIAAFHNGKFDEKKAGWKVAYGGANSRTLHGNHFVTNASRNQNSFPATYMAPYEPGSFQHSPMCTLKRISLDRKLSGPRTFIRNTGAYLVKCWGGFIALFSKVDAKEDAYGEKGFNFDRGIQNMELGDTSVIDWTKAARLRY